MDQNKRLIHEDEHEDGSESDEERVDMSNINMAAQDRKNRQEAFDCVQRQPDGKINLVSTLHNNSVGSKM